MATHDLHAALKTEVVTNTTGAGVQFIVARLQNSKDDSKLSLHAAPNSYSSAGIQTTDFLKYLGFARGSCAFVRGECYCIGVPSDFDLAKFAVAFANSYTKLEEAEKHLDKCAFFLPQPEGWGYFYGKPSGTQGQRHTLFASSGDGHTAPKSESLKTLDDEYFNFVLSFVSGGYEYDKGWVFHYHPKHVPLSAEIRGALKFFDLKPFNQCPFFDFEPCYWRFTEFQEREDEVFSRHTHFVPESFGAHAEHFSKGIEGLLSAQSAMIPFGMSFIPMLNETTKSETAQMSQATLRPKGMSRPHRKYKYDVALSFAGTEREHAEKLANLVRENGFEVFYDSFYSDQLWGKDLVVFFDQIYRKESRYCVMFVSKEYSSRMWTNHERRSAQARMLQERGAEYILPIQVDDAELPGMPSTVGHLSLSEYGIDQIGEILLRKLSSGEDETPDRPAKPNHFVQVHLIESGLANADLSAYRNPPFGDCVWSGVPFRVQNMRISMADISDSQSKLLNSFEPVIGVCAVHFLINAGDGRKRYLGREIGWLNFNFDQDEHPQHYRIILGENVREWAIGNYVTISETDRRPDPLVDTVEEKNSREVWRGETQNGQVAVIDMLTVRIDPIKHSKQLRSIELARSIPRETISLDYFISGITIEVGSNQ